MKTAITTIEGFIMERLKSTGIKVSLFTILLAVLIIMPAYIHSQWYTGPVVNGILLLTVVLIGTPEAILMGLIPGVVALSSGLLPVALAPVLPFIMLGNALFILVFHYFKKTHFMAGLVPAAIIKFVFLHSMTYYIISGLVSEKIAENAAVMMSWPQLVTALIGGTLAWVVLKTLDLQKKK
ncbi:MAG: hypothetical protein ACOCX9_05780 [Spirochaetota bacterium]